MAHHQQHAIDDTLKLLLIGDSGIGKSCLLNRYATDSFKGTFVATIGIDFKIKKIDLDGKRIKLNIWDTAGQERFRTITQSYYRGAMGILVMYDVTSERSFKNLAAWLRDIDKHSSTEVVRMVVGNKCDMPLEKREVSTEDGQKFADENGLDFFECSAKDDINVTGVFTALAQKVKDKRQDGTILTAADRARPTLTPNITQPQAGRCSC